MTRRVIGWSLAALVPATGVVFAQTPTPTPQEIVPKAVRYVHAFITAFTNVVAEERYEQQLTGRRRDKRVLVSDFLLVRYRDDELWQMFRDVAEVDGKPVRDRESRMLKLFLEPSASAIQRAGDLAAASASHNLRDFGILNYPLVAMGFLQVHFVGRFQFTVRGIERKLGANVRLVDFLEVGRPTFLKANTSNADLPSRGSYWIEEDTGRVVKTELQLGSLMLPIRIVTTFRLDQELGIDVPVMMEGWYPSGGGEFRGKATYGKFRRFQVVTEATVAKPGV